MYRATRYRRNTSLIAWGLDYFKQYNDRFGHPAGDECLRKVADALRNALRATDMAARVGGEEFAIVLPETEAHRARVVADSLRELIEGPEIPNPDSPLGHLTGSFGVATSTAEHRGDPGDLLRVADDAHYKAKRKGRNRVMEKRDTRS